MKGILIVLDGAADLPNKQLDNKTPLEAAETPNMDFLAARGELGTMDPVRPGFIPESDEAIVSIFGNELISSTRGQLEAAGTGIKLTRGDLALRANFATINPKTKEVLDRRAGGTLTTDEAEELALDLNRKIKLPFKFTFIPTIQHRGALVFRGGFSDNISGNDVSYYEQGKLKAVEKIKECSPLDENENSQYTANIVNEFLEQAQTILENHPINQERKRRGLMPANYLLVRGAGVEKPKLKLYRKWLSIAYMPLEIGFAALCGMTNFGFSYPKLEELDAYSNLYKGLQAACENSIKIIKKQYQKFDYAYIHIKETDIPGHDNKPLEKKQMIEYIDKTLFNFLRKFAPPNNIKVVVTCDHSTPCKLKSHSADPVPILFYNGSIPKEKKFCEKNAKLGELGNIKGQDLLKQVRFLG